MKEEINKWRNDTGIVNIKNIDSSDVNKILEMPSRQLASMDAKELQHFLIVLSRYKMFLVKNLGELRSQLEFYNELLENQISLSSSRQHANTKEERRALAIKSDSKIGEYSEKISCIKIKYNELFGIPDAIQTFIDSINRLEYRKANNLKMEGKLHD